MSTKTCEKIKLIAATIVCHFGVRKNCPLTTCCAEKRGEILAILHSSQFGSKVHCN